MCLCYFFQFSCGLVVQEVVAGVNFIAGHFLRVLQRCLGCAGGVEIFNLSLKLRNKSQFGFALQWPPDQVSLRLSM